MNTAVIALVVRFDGKNHNLVEIVSDDIEIEVLSKAYGLGEKDPLKLIYSQRQKAAKEEDDFGNYVEELLSQPFIKPEIREHGLQWLKSRIKIEEYKRTEAEAAKIISDFAFRVFLQDPALRDFSLAGPATTIRVRIFVLDEKEQAKDPAQSEAA